MHRLSVGDECDGIRFELVAKQPLQNRYSTPQSPSMLPGKRIVVPDQRFTQLALVHAVDSLDLVRGFLLSPVDAGYRLALLKVVLARVRLQK